MRQLQFDELKTSDDWGIYLSSYEIGDAEPKEYFVDLPSGDGILDLTEALTGGVSYGNRNFTAELGLLPPKENWSNKISAIRSFLNGRSRRLIDPDDPDFFYTGRFKTSFRKDGPIKLLTINGSLNPFKTKMFPTIKNFTIGPDGSVSGILYNSDKRVIPEITTTKDTNISLNNINISLPSGTHKVTNIVLEAGNNPIAISGSPGTIINIKYREGAL